MSKVALDKPAPPFELSDYKGRLIKLEDFSSIKNVLLVFNRGFV